MNEKEKQLEHLSEIRNIMEKSSRFLSLSGLSGVFAGIYALAGAALVYFDFGVDGARSAVVTYANVVRGEATDEIVEIKLKYMLAIGIIVLLLSLFTGFIFSSRKAKKQGLKMWDSTAARMLFSLFVPLIVGGVFCVILIYHNVQYLIAPVTLIFYGLSLLNASKFTFTDIKYLGLSEVILGLISAFFIGYGLLFWAIGFGVLHIIYGTVMYFKYDKV